MKRITIFLDEEKTNGFIYKTISFFSKEKKTTLLDQEKVSYLFNDFSIKTENYNDFKTFSLSNSIKKNKEALKNYKLVIQKIQEEF